MSSPLGNDVTAMTLALIENAKRLGLTWTLRLATVSGDFPTMATCDGDTTAIAMTSMVGSVHTGQRVYVLQVPPSGNFIIGLAAGRYEARQTLAAVAASVTFSSIPAGLRSLRLSYVARADNAVNGQLLLMQVDGDTSAIYYYEYERATDVTPTAVSASAQTSGGIGLCAGALATAGRFATGEVLIPGWDNSVATALGWTHSAQAMGATVATFRSQTGGGIYEAAGPYSSLTIFPNAGSFIAGSDFHLIGEPS